MNLKKKKPQQLILEMIKGGNTLNSLNKGKYVDSLEMAVSFSLLCLQKQCKACSVDGSGIWLDLESCDLPQGGGARYQDKGEGKPLKQERGKVPTELQGAEKPQDLPGPCAAAADWRGAVVLRLADVYPHPSPISDRD